MGVFKAYENSKEDPEVHNLIRYLVNWVAGTKLIFITLLIVITALGDTRIKFFSAIALVLSILTFYWKLYPIIREMENNKELSTSGYSKTLAFTIGGFILAFIVALFITGFETF